MAIGDSGICSSKVNKEKVTPFTKSNITLGVVWHISKAIWIQPLLLATLGAPLPEPPLLFCLFADPTILLPVNLTCAADMLLGSCEKVQISPFQCSSDENNLAMFIYFIIYSFNLYTTSLVVGHYSEQFTKGEQKPK